MRLWHWITLPFRRAPRGPLAQRQPQRQQTDAPPLGYEAIDMRAIASVNRRNASLERVNTFFSTRRGSASFLERAETEVTPLMDDETYAARYHRAYNRKRGKET